MNRNSLLDADEKRVTVRNLAAHGFSDQDIVCYAGIQDSKQLHKEFGHDLETAEIDANLEVARSLYDMATSRKNISATSFWLRCRAAWTVDAEDTYGASGFGPIYSDGPEANE
jgi:hypothetical protein